MNNIILSKKVQDYINKNYNQDITKLILKGSPFQDITPQEIANQLICKKKVEKKLPTWFSSKNIYYPNKISIEQSSSEITAKYKASLINSKTLIDLTGGFGVDCYYFSKNTTSVVHCELNSELSEIVEHNYRILERSNIDTICTDGIEFLKQTDKKFDCIYIDPSRRNNNKKVFLIEDCLPNLEDNQKLLFEKSDVIIVKYSPLLDIHSTVKKIKNISEVHIIAVKNEVKELLFILRKNFINTIKIKTININSNKKEYFDFELENSENTVNLSLPLKYLYEPNAAVLKSGGFNKISKHLKIAKLHKNSHLYTNENIIEFPGRIFSIKKIINYDKRFSKIFTEKKANITTRNFPKTVAEIRKETKIKDGGSTYLFFTKNLNEKFIVIVCEKVNSNIF